jgi:hypothetical protein
MIQFDVKDGIPIPNKKRLTYHTEEWKKTLREKKQKYPWHIMKIKQMFFVPVYNKKIVKSLTSCASKMYKTTGKKFVVRKFVFEGKLGTGVWRFI